MILNTLNAIAERVSACPEALGLLALGSCGLETERIDEHSDLDFFVITTDKQRFVDRLDWLGNVQWSHRNTVDGYKALVDGVLCEFAVFEPTELAGVRFSEGRYVWRRSECPQPEPLVPAAADTDWLTNEILSNLYVGLHRLLRGERLAAMRLIQEEALGHLLRLHGAQDPFDPTRRAEGLGLPLGRLAPGYDGTANAAAAILALLEAPPSAMREAVVELLRRAR